MRSEGEQNLGWPKVHPILKFTGIRGGGINGAGRQPSQKSLTRGQTGTGWVEPVFPGLGKGASIIYNQDETRGLVRNVSMLWKSKEMKHNVLMSARRRERVRDFEKEKKLKQSKNISDILLFWSREPELEVRTWVARKLYSDESWWFAKVFAGSLSWRGWDGWRALPTQWTWVWANSGRWWRTGKPGVLQSIGSQRVKHD